MSGACASKALSIDPFRHKLSKTGLRSEKFQLEVTKLPLSLNCACLLNEPRVPTSRAQNIQTRRQVGHPDWPGHSDTRCAVSVVAYHRGNIWLALLYSLALAMPQPVKSRGPTHVPVWGELLWVKPCVSAGTRLPQYAGGFTPTLGGSPPPVSPNTICGHRAISYISCCALLFVFFPAPLFFICFVCFFFFLFFFFFF